ncbi:MAG: hypothetical protein ABIG30_01295 [Candidatus Aenigmatarchaeota archaeon]
MNKQTRKQMWVFIVIILFFGSTIAYSILQALGVAPTGPVAPTIPSERIFKSENQTIEDLLIQYQYSVLKFYYDGTCCQDIIVYIESIPESTGRQLAVFEITSNTTEPYATIKSLKGDKTIQQPTRKSILDLLCDYIAKPPVECGLRYISNTSSKTNVTS